jgi:hypothetical protein
MTGTIELILIGPPIDHAVEMGAYRRDSTEVIPGPKNINSVPGEKSYPLGEIVGFSDLKFRRRLIEDAGDKGLDSSHGFRQQGHKD